MKHTFTIKSYQELEELLNDLEYKYCKKCKQITHHLVCGINKRWECLKCN